MRVLSPFAEKRHDSSSESEAGEGEEKSSPRTGVVSSAEAENLSVSKFGEVDRK
jgi:hypothetical protein